MNSNILIEMLSTAIIGISVVFIGLLILIGFIKLMSLLFKQQNKVAKPVTGPAVTKETTSLEIIEEGEGITPEVVAAIGAVLSLYFEDNSKFIVKRIIRTKNI